VDDLILPFLDDEARSLRSAAAEFARTSLAPNHSREQFSRETWRLCAEFGAHGVTVPTRFGGRDGGAVQLAALLDGLGYGCPDGGLLLALESHVCGAVVPIASFGSDALKERYLPALAKGDWIGAHCISEPNTGSDAMNLETTAYLDGDAYVLNGHKKFISNGPIADVFVVYASLDRSKRRFGLSAFVVDRTVPGLTIGAVPATMGLHGCPMSDVVLTNCRVPAGNLLGPAGAGAGILGTVMDWERTAGMAWQVGASQRQLERCIRYARERKQFGQPIGSFQTVSNRIANMRVRLDLAQLALYRAVWLIDQKKGATMAASIAKLVITEGGLETHLDAFRIHGGSSYLAETVIEADVRDALAGPIYAGTSDIQRVLIGSLLGLR
jgi:alkylation response protein AidB-like acyl-CoA dehydrogenase